MEKYLTAGDITLSRRDIRDIDEAGRETMFRKTVRRRARTVSKCLAFVVLVAIGAWRMRESV